MRPRAVRVRRGPAVILAAIAVAIAVIGCAADEIAATPTPTVARLQTPTTTPRPIPTPEATPADPVPTDDASLDPGASPTESAAASDSPAAACTGTDDNRTFYATVAAKVAWDVYCPVLGKGWNVVTGSYRTSGGGWLTITYKGPGGRRFELREGAFCTAAGGCVPPGPETGPGAFGVRDGTVIAAADGTFAIVVDKARKISWLAIGTGVDEATFRAQAEALTIVGG